VATATDPPVEAPPANPQEGLPPGAGPMEVDSTAVGTPSDPPSQPGTPRSLPRAPASAHPSGMWFCPIPRGPNRPDGAASSPWSPTSARSTCPGLNILQLLATQIPTLRRVPIAPSSSCARALTCLLQAVVREQTWEALARLPLFPRIELAAPARGGKATRSSYTPVVGP